MVVAAIKDEEGERVAQAVAEAGGKAIQLHHDIGNEGTWKQVMQAAHDRFGGLDVLVMPASAGAGPPEEETL